MTAKFAATFCIALASFGMASADIITTSTLHVGGFFDGGGADNKIEHQNYFVGYGTIGGVRTSERRSFFWYHVPDFDGSVIDVTIKLKMLVKESLIFGLDPTDPTKHDETETFQLGATPIDHFTLTDPDLTTEAAQDIFDALDDHPVASPYDFIKSEMYEFPLVAEIHLDMAGKGLVSSHRGADIVLTGWMPSWSYDERLDASGKYLEADELLFGLSDVPTLVPAPELTIVYEPVPEPCSMVAVALGLAAMARRKRVRNRSNRDEDV